MGRSLRVLLVALAFFSLLASAPSLAQQGQPDLRPQQLIFTPPSPVVQGITVEISVIVENEGSAAAGQFGVEFCWRRVDKEECCGFSRTDIPGLGAGAQETIKASIDTNSLTPGSYEVMVSVDPENAVNESNSENTAETNNRLREQLVILPPEPELHPISLSFDPPSPVEHYATVLISAEIENTGESTAGEFGVEFLRCKGEVLSCLGKPEAEWVSFGSARIPGLRRDEHLRVQQVLNTADLSLDVQENRPYTTIYSIKVAVDRPDRIKEQDEGNNIIIGSLKIEPSKLSLPELHPVRITFNHDLPLEWGRSVTATALIVNTGGSVVTASRQNPVEVQFSYRKSGRVDGWQDLPRAKIEENIGIEEGKNSVTASATIEFAEPGSYELRVWVDPPKEPEDKEDIGKILEQNEDNNQMIVGLSVQGSELHPRSIEIGAAQVRQGDTIRVAAEIENSGAKTAEAFTVGFFIDNLRFDTFYYRGAGLREGDRVKAEGVLDTTDLPCRIDPSYPDQPCGTFTLRVFVDPDNEIPELDETNNVISAPFVLFPPRPRLAELHPTGLTLEPPSPVRQGQVVRVSATIWNTGNIAASRFQVELAYSPDGQSWLPFAVQEIPGLARGAKEIVEGRLPTAGLTLGVSYKIRVLVDPRNEVEELDETNNALIISLWLITPITPPPTGANLTLKELWFSPPSPVAQGTAVQVCAEIANTGLGPAGEFQVEFLYRQDQVGAFVPFASKALPGLEVGRSLTLCEVFITAGLALGSYEIKVIADPANWILELDETDNELVRTLIISQPVPRPDLYPAGLSFDPPSPVAQGELVRVCAKVANLGSAAAGQFTVSFSYFLDSYIQFATATVTGLGAGSQTELCRVLATSPLVPGSYEIKIRIDPEDRVAEANEANNELSGYLTIITPFPPLPQLILGTGGPVRLLELDRGTGVVYIGSEDGKLYALERGAALKAGFPFEVGSPIRALVLDTGAPRAAYLGTADGKLVAVKLETGREICRASLGSEVRALAIDRFGNIYIGAGARLVSLTSACQPRWEFAPLGEVRALIFHDAKDLAYAATSAGMLYALTRDGKVKWQLDLQAPLTALALGEAIYAGTEDGKVRAVSFGGSPSWQFTIGGTITGLAVDVERRDPIYAASSDGKLYSLDLSGRLRWAFPTGGPLYARPGIDGRSGAVFLGSSDGKLYALESAGRETFSVTVGSPIRSTPVIDTIVERVGGEARLVRLIYFGAEDGNIYLIKD